MIGAVRLAHDHSAARNHGVRRQQCRLAGILGVERVELRGGNALDRQPKVRRAAGNRRFVEVNGADDESHTE